MSLFVRDEDSDEELALELSRNDDDSLLKQQKVDEDSANLYPLIPNDGDSQNENLKPNIEDIRPVDIQLSLPLPFQQLIVEDMLVSEDCLLVMGKGLGAEPVVSNLLHVLATPTRIENVEKRSLVLVLNATDEDNLKMSEELLELSWVDQDERPFSTVNAESLSVEKRRKLYLQGGIVSVTSRILIVDLLSGIIHPNKITGIVVLHVEDLTTYSNEAFIIEMYRSVNKWGFVKAVSESAESFSTGISPLRKKLRDLRLKRALLWPRFHVDISTCLNLYQDNKVIEVKVSLTNSMAQIQFGLFGCLKKCIDELNRKNPALALEYWSLDNALDSSFLKSIHSVLGPNWHRISYESKQLVKDINTLRKLLHALVSYDAVDFYEIVQMILDANKPSISRKYSESPWLMADDSQMVISYAKKRVFHQSSYELEQLPKWEQLVALLDDVSHERSLKPQDVSGPTLIMCSDDKTCRQLKKILGYADRKEGCRKLMVRKLQTYMNRRDVLRKAAKDIREEQGKQTAGGGEIQVSRAFAKEEIASKRRRTRGASSVAAVTRLKSAVGTGEDIDFLMTIEDIEQELDKIDDEIENEADEERTLEQQGDEEDEEIIILDEVFIPEEIHFTNAQTEQEVWERRESRYGYVDKENLVIVEKFYNKTDDLLLQELMPSYIIMYEPDLSFIRRVEIYRAIHKDSPPKVYFMYYGDSVEEQGHLTAIRKEKEAFTKLIREKSQLAQHFETDEDLSRFKNLVQRRLQLSNTNTRIAGGQQALNPVMQDVVIVDMREFRAPLPGLLYRYGVKVVPCMLTVGDYILTPKICVERKSIADLIGSIKNGRLFDQCKNMSRYYDYPTLLIEFDGNQSFSLEPFSERRVYNTTSSTAHPISSQLMQDEIQMQLAQLVMKFPNLKILWSSSPLQTVNIILDLKVGREQPNPSESIEFGIKRKGNRQADNNSTKFQQEKMKELLRIPGLSNIDYFNIVKSVKNYRTLQKMNEVQLSDLLGDPDLAKRIYSSVQKEIEEHNEDMDGEDGAI